MLAVTIATPIDARDIAPDLRLSTITAAFRQLELGEVLEIIDGQDSRSLYHHLRAEAPGDFSWICRKTGPDVWHVCVQKLGRAHSAGDCCGACGGAAAH